MTGLAIPPALPAWDAALQTLGLDPVKRGAGRRNETIGFRVRSGWGTFEIRGKRRRTEPPVGRLGHAGLWKPVTDELHKGVRAVFELPPTVMTRAAADPSLCEGLARWAVATAAGGADASWSPPPREEVERWIPAQALTLQVGTIARQGSMRLDEGCLVFSFPVVSRVPDRLPAHRREWLQELLDDARERWRFVRVGMADDSEARAEVDLTGAPAGALEELVRTGVDALRLVVSSLAEPAEFLVNLANGADGCRALEIGPSGRSPGTRTRTRTRTRTKKKRRTP